jgi:WD40 repeat protein
VITGGDDGTARLWSSSGQSLAVLRDSTQPVVAAAFSPDGHRFVTASKDGSARVYACNLCGSFDELLGLAARVPQSD